MAIAMYSRVVRGGGWGRDVPLWVRAAVRNGNAPTGRRYEVGVRCVVYL